jgi:hypothetical protein
MQHLRTMMMRQKAWRTMMVQLALPFAPAVP